MTIKGVISYAHTLLSQVISKGDMVVDATAGNGYDTVFLAKRVGPNGKVIALDIQKDALQNTRAKLIDANLDEQVQLIHDSHENIHQYLKGPIQAAIFNLGYLPGGDKTIATQSKTTIKAMEQLGEALLPGGIIAVVVYPGHDEGRIESNELLTHLNSFPTQEWKILKYEIVNPNHPPYLLAFEKRKRKS